MIPFRISVQEDRHIEQSCPGNNEVVEIMTGQLHYSEETKNLVVATCYYNGT